MPCVFVLFVCLFFLKIVGQTKHAWLSKNFHWNTNKNWKLNTSQYLWNLMSNKTKQMLIVWTSTAHGHCKLPFGNSLFPKERLLSGLRAPKSGKAHLSPLKVFCLSSELHWKYLPGVTEANATVWFICFRNQGSQKLYSVPIAAFSSEWSWHLLLSCVASSHTCTLCVQSWPCLCSGTAERGVSVPGSAPPWVEWAMRMRGVGAGGRRVEDRSGADCATATAGLTSFRCPKAALFL